ncbi:family 43 glycosylhydrolase [Pseudoflavitalea sp. X16]|uniref:family 43 glycosylhydrolase n=1 Tax=Paraflavitalea devenefica TaxID=2716334 RepID=UPI0014209CC4|nr:family 43 glycosylhydrolase [Paraflavitalea devenefica]NII29312.1 family 43 glycosylhydrolase [Paraflavitalea devenefica]
MITRTVAVAFFSLLLTTPCLYAQPSGPGSNASGIADADSARFYNTVNTYVNPVLPGDHPDPTLLKVGDDFYHCGSSFHFNPYLPIYHSKDLVHWKVIGRVLPPAQANMVSDGPSKGVWQGAITYFYGSYWIYFSSNGQWFSKAASPAGPWSAPVKVETNPKTGNLGYDNSIFIDDDGKPYMVIKNGQKVNRLQALGRDGQLTDSVINLDWINAHLQYSWAEGPVMCKRNGYYYYFPAGDVSGGQYVLRARELTADSTKWERLGDFFKPSPDPNNTFPRPNHISAPIQLADGTWWTIGQSYQKHGADDWSGMGRQTSLYQVIWENDRPWGLPPVSTPVLKPALKNNRTPWRSVHSDDFGADKLGAWWHFLNKGSAASYSLSSRKGWVRLTPDSSRTHLVQKETDHFYSALTRLDIGQGSAASKGGIYLTNGDQRVFVRLFYASEKEQHIVLQLDTAMRKVPYNNKGKGVWLKLERYEHRLTGYYSVDGRRWLPVGTINAVPLDKVQPNFNSWVGTSMGLFAEGGAVDFDLFICKDGFSSLPVVGNNNHFGIQKIQQGGEWAVTNHSNYGGWLMIAGVDFGIAGEAKAIEVMAGAAKGGVLEVVLDDLQEGEKIAAVPIKSGKRAGHVALLRAGGGKISGQHDLFVRFPAGTPQDIVINSIRLLRAGK